MNERALCESERNKCRKNTNFHIFLYFEFSSWVRKAFSQSAKLLTIAQVSTVRKIVDSRQLRQTPKRTEKVGLKAGWCVGSE